MARVWLIRHGESEANAGMPTGEPATIKLTAKGHKQAQEIADAFVTAPSLIVTSPFLRTKETAQPTIERFRSAPSFEWQIQEFNYLADSRRKNTTLEQRQPMAEEYWSRGDVNYVDGDGAESFVEMMGRIHDLWTKIRCLENEFVAIFTHGLFIRIFIWFLLVKPQEITSETMSNIRVFLTSFPIPNGAILPLQVQSQEIWLGSIMISHLQEFKLQSNWDD